MAIRWAALAVYVALGWLLTAATPLRILPSLFLVCAVATVTALFAGHWQATRRELRVADPRALQDRSEPPDTHGMS